MFLFLFLPLFAAGEARNCVSSPCGVAKIFLLLLLLLLFAVLAAAVERFVVPSFDIICSSLSSFRLVFCVTVTIPPLPRRSDDIDEDDEEEDDDDDDEDGAASPPSLLLLLLLLLLFLEVLFDDNDFFLLPVSRAEDDAACAEPEAGVMLFCMSRIRVKMLSARDWEFPCADCIPMLPRRELRFSPSVDRRFPLLPPAASAVPVPSVPPFMPVSCSAMDTAFARAFLE